MERLKRELVCQVDELKGRVSDREYAEAIRSLKALGGQVGAFAAMHAAFVAGLLGASVGLGAAMVSMGPIGVGLTFVTGVPTIGLGYLFAASQLNVWYDELGSADRAALTKTIAYGIGKSRLLWKAWKLLAR